MDYSLLLITEQNPEFEERRKATIKKKRDLESKASLDKPGIVEEVSEAAENDENFVFPDKSPQRDEFASIQIRRMAN